MPVIFKVIKRGKPGVVGGGVKKNYAVPVTMGELTLVDLTNSIEKRCTVTGADIRAVVYALVDVAIENLTQGHIVRLGDLGSLRITLSSEGMDLEDQVTSDTIKKAGVIFTPGSRIKEMFLTMKYHKE